MTSSLPDASGQPASTPPTSMRATRLMAPVSRGAAAAVGAEMPGGTLAAHAKEAGRTPALKETARKIGAHGNGQRSAARRVQTHAAAPLRPPPCDQVSLGGSQSRRQRTSGPASESRETA
eukprot:CAMPEP_0204606086 /NCGR_PEP_ID=MMETSP0661-20131031/58883_1 /ASSEMBLY_ACC=CAM_ASM_000606 /TAXON_ID=109239 /ORGANISM="Alexandrium margalefi, Strain AMGDE01CS-322" /LENGTH=119 /DNA_ID=CAMNT_0051617377 /DNA_START=195 /DNA_END=551 /DNA_ORIENTATION=+